MRTTTKTQNTWVWSFPVFPTSEELVSTTNRSIVETHCGSHFRYSYYAWISSFRKQITADGR